MTPAQIQRVRATFARIRPQANAVGRAFYGRLFALNPATRPLFPTELDAQADKLMAMFDAIIDGLDAPDRLQTLFRAMGERHAGYGVDEDHYDDVGAALLQSLRAALGSDFDSETEAAWAAVYAEIAEAMIAAARTSPAG